MVPDIRIQNCNDKPENPSADYVLYWMIANRRVSWNFSLDRAVEWSRKLGKPLVIFEPLRCGYRWASDRIHKFIVDGMADNAAIMHSREAAALYYPYLESKAGEGSGLLQKLSDHACIIVTDDFPSFFLPRMIDSAARQVAVRMEKIDSNGLLPMRAADKVFSRAYDFRRFLQKNLPYHLETLPQAKPFQQYDPADKPQLPDEILEKWPAATAEQLTAGDAFLRSLPIDHAVQPVEARGGSHEALRIWQGFLTQKLNVYTEDRNEPEKSGTSGLSPYLHFGHISAHQMFSEITAAESWKITGLSNVTDGSRSGWWGMQPDTESFLDELITWREVGYNMCWQEPDYDQYASLPPWAIKTLDDHRNDLREHIYTFEEFELAQTHDDLWNAAQKQLRHEGKIHNYLRMLWGKKILEWSRSPEEALATLIELNNKYALDGRNPNSYSGIFWTLGRYDRAWGPERPVFGKIRFMSSQNTARKYAVKGYIKKQLSR